MPASILWAVSYFGTGHVYRNLVVADHLLGLRPHLSLQFIAAGDVPALIRDAGYRCRSDLVWDPMPISDGRLNPVGFVRAWLAKERGNLPVYRCAVRQHTPDLVISDELPSLLSASAEMNVPSIYFTDVLSVAPVHLSSPTQLLTHGLLSLIRPVLNRRMQACYQKAGEVVFFGQPQDVCARWRGWAEENVYFAGPVVRRVPRLKQPVRHLLGIDEDSVLITVTAGGSDAGEHLLRMAALSLGQILERISRAHMLLVTGPALCPEQLRTRLTKKIPAGRLSIRGFLPGLPAYMKASDLVVTLGGHATLSELYIRTRTPALVCPLGGHWEQERNAVRAAEQGWAEVIFRDRLTPCRLGESAVSILSGRMDLRRTNPPPEPTPRAIARLLAGYLPPPKGG